MELGHPSPDSVILTPAGQEHISLHVSMKSCVGRNGAWKEYHAWASAPPFRYPGQYSKTEWDLGLADNLFGLRIRRAHAFGINLESGLGAFFLMRR